ncbi:MAG: hypothetical protein WCS37_02865 [Chloroflexota bacterium]|nr:hypothetical protein [Chloroflexota bacterium]
MSPKQLLQRIYVLTVVLILLVTAAGCGPESPTPLPGGGQGAVDSPTPAATFTPLPTNTPVPTSTPTEIPLILPTPTQVDGPLPLPTGGLLPPTFPPAPTPTLSPTIVPVPPITPTATTAPTPLPPLRLNIFANYMKPLSGYSIPGYYPAPEQSTECINVTYLNLGLSSSQVAPAEGSSINLYGPAADDYWYNLFRERYVFVAAGPPAGPNSTAGPYNASTPFTGPLPPGTPGYLAVTPTPNPPQPYTAGEELRLGSLIITDTVADLADITYNKPELMVMWNVMNNLTRQLIDPTIDPKAYQQSYEAALNQLVNAVLRVNSISRIIIGNVPDLTNMRYFKTCFNNAQLKQIQTDYNGMFAALAKRYPGRVYIARLDQMDLLNHPQWVYIQDGLRFTQMGATEVAATFGRVFQTIHYR